MSAEAKQNFGPFADVSTKDIHPTNFDCPRCKLRVRKHLKYIHEMADCIGIYVCDCIGAAAWQLENPPSSSSHWERLVKMAKKTGAEFVVLDPKAGATLHGGTV